MRIVAVVILLFSLPARAVEWPEANPQRPSFSSNAAPTVPGALELETGVAVSRARGADEHGVEVPTSLKVGLTPWIGVTVETAAALNGDAGLTHLGLAVKLTARQPEDRTLGLALSLSGAPPPPVGEDAWGAVAALIATYAWDDFEIDANVVLDATFPAVGDTALVVAPVATFCFPIAGELGGYGEAHVEIPTDGGDPAAVVAAGLGYTIAKNVVVDAAVDVGLNDAAPAYVIQAGLTVSMFAWHP